MRDFAAYALCCLACVIASGSLPLSPARTGCALVISGSSGPVSNADAIDCIQITNASVTGDIGNTGSILQNGIVVTNSNIAGTISNVGSLAGGNIATFAGGISTDSQSSIAGTFVGISLIGIPTFSGGINNNATITGNSNGIYVDSVTSFTGGINNAGPVTASNGISISNISTFTGGISNAGKLTTTNYGITQDGVSNFSGGIFNSGDITSTGCSARGCSSSTSPTLARFLAE